MRSERVSYKLDQLGFVGRGKSKHRPRNDPSLYGGDYPFFQTGDVKGAELYLRCFSATYNEKGLAQSKLWQPGTLCITIAANIADSSILSIPGCFPDSVVGFVADPQRSDVFFVKYYLDTLKSAMQSISHGTTQDNLSLQKLLSFDFWVPSVEEQRKIASVLLAYDDLIENNTRRIEILEEMARRLYEEWFVQFRFPGHEGVEFKESELGLIPKSWSVVKLEEICDLITDGAHKSPPTAETGMPMASVKDMHDWGVDVSKCRKISRSDYDDLVRNNCKPMIGDVLVAKDGSYLKHIFSVEKDQDLVLLSSIAILRPINKSVSDLLVCLLRHPETIARMKGCVSGVAIPRIILKDFRKFQIVFPSQDLQEAWLATASPLMRLCRKLVDKNANLRAQRDLLLPKLISGEIDVSDIPMPT